MHDGSTATGSTANERMRRVLELLETRDAVSVAELAQRFAVSEVTVRSDLTMLARQGLVVRVRGGARALQRGQSEVAFDVRLRVEEEGKRAIARASAEMVVDGEAVALDSSTTAFYIALELRQKRELVIVTNGLRVASAIADAPGVSVIVLGGVVRTAAMSVVGDFASSVLRNTRIGRGFFGARGISADRGLMDLNPDEVKIKREMADACERVVGVFDHTKWRRSALLTFVPTQRIDAIVTDAGAPPELVQEWRDRQGRGRDRGIRSQGGGGHDRNRLRVLPPRRGAGGRAPSNPPPKRPPAKGHQVKPSLTKQLTSIAAICLLGAMLLTTATAATSLKTGLKVYVIPKNLGNPYFTTSDSVKSGGALKALKDLKEKGTETSGTQATASSQIPAIQAAITKGANALIVSATDASALCPTLKAAMAKKITVVTYDSDAPACRNIFINQADSKAIGTSQVDLLAKQIGRKGEIAVVSAAASATNQNAWIAYMKTQLRKYPDMKLVDVVYGNDDPTTSTQVTQGLLQKHPNLKGIISPTTVGIAAAAAVLDTAQYRGKIKLTGLGTPNSLRKYVKDGTIEGFELWNPADLGYLAAYAAVNHASGTISGKRGQTFKAGRLGSYRIGAKSTVLLGPPFVFNKANIDKFHF